MNLRRNKIATVVFLLFCISLLSSCVTAGRESTVFEPVTTLSAPQTDAGNDIAGASESESFEESVLYDETNYNESAPVEKMRAFWISYEEIGDMYSKGAERFESELTASFEKLAALGFNTVFFHARAFCDAFYSSSIFPWSSYVIVNGALPSTDPLLVAVNAAHSCGMRIHAWINPYRVSYNNDINSPGLSAAAKQMIASGQAQRLMVTDSGIFLDPSSLDNQSLILDGVREILSLYSVDGIHIDDYFYPSDVENADEASYQSYVAAGGKLQKADWRRANVSAVVAGLYSVVKSFGAEKEFGISPGGIFDLNYNTYYADVETWIKQPGYCDYIIPQIYFGYLHNTCGFDELLAYWSGLCSGSAVRLYIGLGLYKAGKTDEYAGSEEARREWVEYPDLIARQAESVGNNAICRGFAVFSFEDLLYQGDNDVKKAQTESLFEFLREQNLYE